MKNTIITTLFLGLSSFCLIGCGHGVNAGTGKKIGQVIQIGQHGWFPGCSTYEGKLVRGGFNTGSGVSGGVFEFTVDSKDLFDKLNDVMEKQQEIEVTYNKTNFSGACTSDSNHFVTGFKILTETTPSVVVKSQDPNVVEKERQKQELMKKLKELEN